MKKHSNRNLITLIFTVIVGLIIVNSNSISFKAIFADENDYNKSADVMANFIVAEYNRQLNDGTSPQIKHIVAQANKLNDLGLTIKYADELHKKEVVIFREVGNTSVIYKRLSLK